jgi:hypothetical protein
MNRTTATATSIATALLLGFSSGAARAQAIFSDAAVISGSSLQWGQVANKLNLNYGRVRIASVGNIELNGLQITTKGVGLNAVFATGQGPQASKTAYYVYYAQAGTTPVFDCAMCGSNICNAPNCNVYTPVISTTPPFAEGYPSAGISYTVGGNLYGPTKNAVFLGSYITDNNGDMVPFDRQGEEVHLIFNTRRSTVHVSSEPYSFTPTSKGIAGVAGAYPQIQKYDVTTMNHDVPNWNYPVPASASGVIASVCFFTTQAQGLVAMSVLDPNLLTVNADNSWFASNIPTQVGGIFPVSKCIERIRVQLDAAHNLYIIDESQPPVGQTDSATAAYWGYVESVHHLY